MEARQIILAHAAGAELVKNGTWPCAVPAQRAPPVPEAAWLLAESTLAAPAVVSASAGGAPRPARSIRPVPQRAARRRGRRQRDRQRASASATPTRTPAGPPRSRQAHDAQAGDERRLPRGQRHAARVPGGPCERHLEASETGGRSWGFVPYDLLGKLRERMRPQAARTTRTCLRRPCVSPRCSCPARGARIGRRGLRERRGCLAHRDPLRARHRRQVPHRPGRHGARAVTRSSLDDRAPILLWNRGNPDTQDGPRAGTVNNDTADDTPTPRWARPGRCRPSPSSTRAEHHRAPADGVEFVAYMGSGYGPALPATKEASSTRSTC